jgi:hypothetical protein
MMWQGPGYQKRSSDLLANGTQLLLELKDCASGRILESMGFIGKLFGRPKSEPPEAEVSVAFVSDKLFRRATKRIFAKYKVTIRKLVP